MISYVPDSVGEGLTNMGCTSPFDFIDSASSLILFLSNSLRGCDGLGFKFEIEIFVS